MSVTTTQLTFSRSVPELLFVNILLPYTIRILSPGNISGATEAPRLLLALSPRKLQILPNKNKNEKPNSNQLLHLLHACHIHSGHSALGSGPGGRNQPRCSFHSRQWKQVFRADVTDLPWSASDGQWGAGRLDGSGVHRRLRWCWAKADTKRSIKQQAWLGRAGENAHVHSS